MRLSSRNSSLQNLLPFTMSSMPSLKGIFWKCILGIGLMTNTQWVRTATIILEFKSKEIPLGAFAFFGPGKFESLFRSLNGPAADGLLHFAGEAQSVRHAWVEGALDSAWRAVAELLCCDDHYRH